MWKKFFGVFSVWKVTFENLKKDSDHARIVFHHCITVYMKKILSSTFSNIIQKEDILWNTVQVQGESFSFFDGFKHFLRHTSVISGSHVCCRAQLQRKLFLINAQSWPSSSSSLRARGANWQNLSPFSGEDCCSISSIMRPGNLVNQGNNFEWGLCTLCLYGNDMCMRFSLHAVHVFTYVCMNASFLCLFVDGLGEGCSSHQSPTVDKAEQAKQSRAAVLEDMNSWLLDPETSLPLGGRPGGGECPWNGFGTLAAQYDVYTFNISFSIIFIHLSSFISL